jgi:hypothetical protein
LERKKEAELTAINNKMEKITDRMAGRITNKYADFL